MDAEYDYSEYYTEDDYDSEEYDRIILCYCQGHCPSGEEEGICQVSFGGKCFTTVEEEEDEYGDKFPLLSYGCFSAGTTGIMQCKANLVPHAKNKSIQCCDDGDFCNNNLFSDYTEAEFVSTFKNLPVLVLVSSIVGCFFVAALVAIAFFALYRRKEKKKKESGKNRTINNNETPSRGAGDGTAVVGRNLADAIEQSSGSGSGLPLMVQRTIAKQIEMGIPIGKGRFGEVWLARWREDKVAVKVFLTVEEKSWDREKEVYQTLLMRHDNILGFVAADIKGSAGWTQLLLITEYHERGSLYDFLQGNTLNPSSLLTMCTSIVRGLSHLHTEILGTPGKPSIAHRDIKSKNILVKRNDECCIADFGLAMKFDRSAINADVRVRDRTGSKRYMAPEILDGTIHFENFEAHILADMYACGLVFWEMSKRCTIGDDPTSDYTPPFHDQVPSDPSFEQMQEVVCVKKIRPDIPERWYSVEILQTLARTMQELWHDNPTVRLTALRVKKTLNKRSEDVAINIE